MIEFDKFEILTFDCYGTLIDWESGILNVLRPMLAEWGVAVDDDQILETYAQIESAVKDGPYKPYHTVLRELMAKLCEQFGFFLKPHEFTALADSLPNWPPFEDTVAGLKKLKSKFQLGIISNIDDDLFAGSNKQLEVEFDYIITAEQVGAYKPATTVFEYALEKIGLSKQKILHVAQSLYHDHVPAQQLGLTTVWINRRGHKTGTGATPHAEATPDAEFPDLASLVKAVGL